MTILIAVGLTLAFILTAVLVGYALLLVVVMCEERLKESEYR